LNNNEANWSKVDKPLSCKPTGEAQEATALPITVYVPKMRVD